jgi:hypothetical protein
MKLIGKNEESHFITDSTWRVSAGGKSDTCAMQFSIPKESSKQTILARLLADIVCSGDACWVEITFWHADDDANQDLFYGYRLGHADVRRLHEASLYSFSPTDVNRFISIVGMVLYFSWDARIIDLAQTCAINLSHDDLLDCTVQSSSILEPFLARFSALGMLN